MPKVVGALKDCVGEGKAGAIGAMNDVMFATVLGSFRDTDSIDYLWLDCTGLRDAPLAFWELYKARALAPVCHVVFTSVPDQKPGLRRAWQELSHHYGGTQFGNLFLFTFTNLVKPPTMSCMKGLI
jgi:hypothetical protein